MQGEYAVSTRTRQDWILWAQLGCALVATAHAEYTLVTALGQHWVVAGAVTGALDLYVVRALQKHKDVLPAVLVMVAANVVSILISARVVPVHWAVLGAVGALAPLLVWRGHRLRVHEMRQAQEAGTPAGAVSAPEVPVPVDVPASHPCDRVAPYGCRFTDRCAECGYAYGVHPMPEIPAPAPAWVPGFHRDGCDGLCQGTGPVACTLRANALAVPVPEDDPDPDLYVPEDWKEVHLRAVPDLPPDVPGFDPAAALHSPVLVDSDWEYLAKASEYVHSCKDLKRTPSIRGLRLSLNVGQDRAERLLEHLGERRKK